MHRTYHQPHHPRHSNNTQRTMAPDHDKEKVGPVEEIKQICRVVLPTGFTVAAFGLSVSTSILCNFIKFTSTSGYHSPITVQFDPWRHETLSYHNDTNGNVYIVEHCTGYSDQDEIDSKWIAARAFTIMPLILGLVGLNLFFIAACDIYKVPKFHLVASMTYFLASLFQGLSLLFLDSNACKNNALIQSLNNNSIRGTTFGDTCTLSEGGKNVIFATVSWFMAATLSLVAHRSKKRDNDADANTMAESFIDENVALKADWFY